MTKMTLTEAFARYGAKLKNRMWAYTAIATDGSFVFSCWNHRLKPKPGGLLRYEDNMTRWAGNVRGKNLLRDHLKQAFQGNLRVRLVVATAKDPELIDKGEGDASKMSKTISVRETLWAKSSCLMVTGS